jgi:hypothetical protein
MCWPILIPLAIGAFSGLMQGQQQSAQAQSQANALRQNALFLNRSADDAIARGAIDADQQRVQTQGIIGSQRAAQAANGGMVNEGTNALIQEDTAQLGELDALTISNNAAREAYGLRVEAENNLTNASALTKNARRNMFTSILGGALGGASSAFSGGMFSSGTGAGTQAAIAGTTRLNNNQAYA